LERSKKVVRLDFNSRYVIKPFDFNGVQLLGGFLGDQYRNIRDIYYSIPNDSILWDFRFSAGLTAPGEPLGGIHGTSPFGQWLSAFARMYKATGDTAMRDKAFYLLEEWAKTISEDLWNRSLGRMGHYTYDKIVCGLVDLIKYAGNKNVLIYLNRITDWAEDNLDRRRPYAGGGEWYTLSENLYRAYEVTGDRRYFEFAKIWEYTKFWDLLAKKEDIFTALKEFECKYYHAYSHVNSLSGAAMAYKLTGERYYLDALINAYEFLQETQCFATGGYGPDENLIVPDLLPETLKVIRRKRRRPGDGYFFAIESNPLILYHFETPCGSWAAFKLARYLMTFTGRAHYGDWIERLVYNGVGAVIPTRKDGTIMYGSRYHLYGAQKTLWAPWSCCTGTLPQAVTEYHNLIYFYDEESIYINLFTSSRVEWNGPDCQVIITQETIFPEEETVLIRVEPEIPSRFDLKFRVPEWAKDGVKVKVNNILLKVKTVPGEWAVIDRRWKTGDIVTLKFNMSPRIEPLLKYPSPFAILCGPVVMVATSDPRDMPHELFSNLPSKLTRSKGKLEYSLKRGEWKQIFKPFYKVGEYEYYRMYFERPIKDILTHDKIKFHGHWFLDGDIMYTNVSGSYFECSFIGSTLSWEGLRSEDGGRAEVFIDGKKVTEVSQYAYTDLFCDWNLLDQRYVPFNWSISDLDEDKHILKVVVSPNKDPSSKGTKITVRRIIIYV